jgi:predicted  nucleic acid-binding Zn-ribbon protein
VIDWKMRSKRMALWKRELLDSLNRDLTRARNKRDAFTSGVTTLTAQISELEARLSAETERRQRDRVAGEIVVIKKRVRDRSSAFSTAIAGIRNATEAAETIVPEAHELNELLDAIATEVAKAIDGLLSQLDLRIEAVCAGNAAPELPQSLTRSAESPQISDRVHHLRKWLPRKQPTKKADQRSSAAA